MKIYLSSYALVLLSLFLTSHALKVKLKEQRSPETRQPLSLAVHAALVTRAEDVMSNTVLKPKLDKRAIIKRAWFWTDEDEKRLIRLREEEGKSWEELVEYFPGRTWQALHNKYGMLKSASKPKKTSKQGEQKGRKRWTREEDEILSKLKERNESWENIAKRFPERSQAAVSSRWTYLRRDNRQAPATTRKTYTDEENELLIGVAEMDIKWSERAKYFPGRSIKSLQNQLDRLKQGDQQVSNHWTSDEEDHVVEELKRGKTVEEVAESLGRSMKTVKTKVYQLRRLGRIQTAGQLLDKLPPTTIADFELIRKKRKEGMLWKDIMGHYFPGRPEWGPKDTHRYYTYVKKMEEKEASEGNED